MCVDVRRQRCFKISCDTRIIDVTCLTAGKKEIKAFAIGIFTSLVKIRVLSNKINASRPRVKMQVDLESKYSQKKASRGESYKIKIRTNYKSGSGENWPECALYNNK